MNVAACTVPFPSAAFSRRGHPGLTLALRRGHLRVHLFEFAAHRRLAALLPGCRQALLFRQHFLVQASSLLDRRSPNRSRSVLSGLSMISIDGIPDSWEPMGSERGGWRESRASPYKRDLRLEPQRAVSVHLRLLHLLKSQLVLQHAAAVQADVLRIDCRLAQSGKPSDWSLRLPARQTPRPVRCITPIGLISSSGGGSSRRA